jgi:hypothetical protein
MTKLPVSGRSTLSSKICSSNPWRMAAEALIEQSGPLTELYLHLLIAKNKA